MFVDIDNLIHVTLGAPSLMLLTKFAWDSMRKNGRNGNARSGDRSVEE